MGWPARRCWTWIRRATADDYQDVRTPRQWPPRFVAAGGGDVMIAPNPSDKGEGSPRISTVDFDRRSKGVAFYGQGRTGPARSSAGAAGRGEDLDRRVARAARRRRDRPAAGRGRCGPAGGHTRPVPRRPAYRF